MHTDISRQFQDLVAAARRVASDVGEAVESTLRAGLESPLSPEEARALLTRMVAVIRERAAARGDSATAVSLEADVEALIQRALAARASLDRSTGGGRPSLLEPHDGIRPDAVRPTPIFHMRPVPVRQGFVRTRDIRLWDENARLEIHLAQFREKQGRAPTSAELLDIMMGKLQLPGLGEVDDQFEIKELARSIAINGVRKPPILDVDGTLLDGNRRVTACRLILDSADFPPEAKSRAEWVVAWELTEHATEADRDAVVVSLNFEPDNKQDWPKYVKARKVYAEWEALLALEPRPNPPAVRQAELRRQLAQKFALATNEVSKFIDMVRTAEEFEDYQTEDRKRDHYVVKHRAAEAFEYFDELSKGKSAGGVQHTLNQDESFKHLVFDLLFDGKFKRWDLIRDLKHVAGNEEARDMLRRAAVMSDQGEAQDLVTDACAMVKLQRREQRTLGANQRIEAFCKWFDDLPVAAFREGEPGAVSRANLGRLHVVLKNVEANLAVAAEGHDAG